MVDKHSEEISARITSLNVGDEGFVDNVYTGPRYVFNNIQDAAIKDNGGVINSSHLRGMAIVPVEMNRISPAGKVETLNVDTLNVVRSFTSTGKETTRSPVSGQQIGTMTFNM